MKRSFLLLFVLMIVSSLALGACSGTPVQPAGQATATRRATATFLPDPTATPAP